MLKSFFKQSVITLRGRVVANSYQGLVFGVVVRIAGPFRKVVRFGTERRIPQAAGHVFRFAKVELGLVGTVDNAQFLYITLNKIN